MEWLVGHSTIGLRGSSFLLSQLE